MSYILVSARELDGHDRWQAYDPLTGENIGNPSHSPFFTAARALVAAGKDPEAMLYLVRQGDTDFHHWRLRARLGQAARLAVEETKNGPPVLRKYKPFGFHPAKEAE